MIAAVVLLLAGLAGSLVVLPMMATKAVISRMDDAGLKGASARVEVAGPFYTGMRDVAFSRGSLTMQEAKIGVSYTPSALFGGGSIDALTIDGARLGVDLDALAASSAGGVSPLKLPFYVGPMVDSLPVRSLLVRDAGVSLRTGGRSLDYTIDAIARRDGAGMRGATVSASGSNGDQILLCLDGKDGLDTIDAEGSVDAFGWLVALGPKVGIVVPDDVGVEAAPLVFQLLVDHKQGNPGSWVCVLSQPWFQFEKGSFVFLAQDLRAGVTGGATGLSRAAAEGDLFLTTGSVALGPFHPYLSSNGGDSFEIRASDVPVANGRGKMRLEQISATAFMPESGGDVSFRGTVKADWMPAPMQLSISTPATLDEVFVDVGLSRTELPEVAVPEGWMPSSVENLVVSGGIDADLYVTAGGLTAGGFSAAARIGSDGASASALVCGIPVNVSDVSVRNARFSTMVGGFSFELPQGLKAGSLAIGPLTFTDVQIWPSHISVPGVTGFGSMTARFYGGRVVSGAVKGEMDAEGVLKPSTRVELTVTKFDLASLCAALFPGKVALQGCADLALLFRPAAEGAAPSLDLTLAYEGGTVTMRDVRRTEDGIRFDAQLDDIPAGRIAALIPQIKGTLEGRLDGQLSCTWKDGVLFINPGRISLDTSAGPARLRCDNAAELAAQMNLGDAARERMENTLRDMQISSFSVEIGNDPAGPVLLTLVGEGAMEESLPLDVKLRLNGQIAEGLEWLFGNKFEVRFAPAAE
jgi:hypothetical protein